MKKIVVLAVVLVALLIPVVVSAQDPCAVCQAENGDAACPCLPVAEEPVAAAARAMYLPMVESPKVAGTVRWRCIFSGDTSQPAVGLPTTLINGDGVFGDVTDSDGRFEYWVKRGDLYIAGQYWGDINWHQYVYIWVNRDC